jgi:integrase/recombinase XerD
MKTIAKRAKQPPLSEDGEYSLAQYERRLRVEEDVSSATIRNYLSDLRQFMAWCESLWQQGREDTPSFVPEAVTTPTLTQYRISLQALQLKPNSINRSLISLKRYFAWLMITGQLTYDPAKVVKLVGEEIASPRHLDDQEEQALVAAVKKKGTVRDQAIIVLMLHTGLRAREVCTLTRAQVHLGKRSGSILVHGKRNKYRDIPLNTTARAALEAYDSFLTTSHARMRRRCFVHRNGKHGLPSEVWGILSKNMPSKQNSMMLVHMTCVTASAIAWRGPSRYTDLLNLWAMIH